MTTNTYGGYTTTQLRKFIAHTFDPVHGGDTIDELTGNTASSANIVRDLLDAIEPQKDGDLLRPIARWVYNAVRVNLDLLHGICSEFGCPQGEDVATWLRARLAAHTPTDDRAARLDDADIDTIAESMPGGLDSFMKQWGWRQFARAVEDEVIINVARTASASETMAERWMTVADQLPPLGHDVLVAVQFFGPGDWRIKVGALNDQGQWRVFGGSWAPTHWMPLPDAPVDAARAEDGR